MDKKLSVILLSAVFFVLLLISACSKNSPANPEPAPVHTATPVATILVDDFEDGDTVNSITPPDASNNYWTGFWDSNSSYSTSSLCGAAGGDLGADSFSNTINLNAAIATPVSQYTGFAGPCVNVFTDKPTNTGIDISSFSSFKFDLRNHIVTAPLNGSVKYEVQLYNAKLGYMVRAQYTPVNDEWKSCEIPLADFSIPDGYYGTPAVVLSNTTQVSFYYSVYAPVSNTAAEMNAVFDNIKFLKY